MGWEWADVPVLPVVEDEDRDRLLDEYVGDWLDSVERDHPSSPGWVPRDGGEG